MSIHGYDYSHIKYRALKSTNGDTDLALFGSFTINDNVVIFKDAFQTSWAIDSMNAITNTKMGEEHTHKIAFSKIKCQRGVFQELLDTTARLRFPPQGLQELVLDCFLYKEMFPLSQPMIELLVEKF